MHSADGRGHIPAVLLLHGQPGSAADWDGVVRALGELVTPIAIDRPGWDGVHSPRDLAGNVQAALSALDARGTERALVVGHSLGAAVAAWLAATHPSRVTALVLAAPAANRAALYPVDRWLAAPIAGEIAGSATLAGAGVALSLPWLRRHLSARTGIDESYLRGIRRVSLTPRAWRAYVSEQRTLVRDLPKLERHLPAITAPTTVVAGAADRVVPARASRLLSEQIRGARLLVSQHSGHLLPQRHPQLLADAILEMRDGPAPVKVGAG